MPCLRGLAPFCLCHALCRNSNTFCPNAKHSCFPPVCCRVTVALAPGDGSFLVSPLSLGSALCCPGSRSGGGGGSDRGLASCSVLRAGFHLDQAVSVLQASGTLCQEDMTAVPCRRPLLQVVGAAGLDSEGGRKDKEENTTEDEKLTFQEYHLYKICSRIK